jgi:nucleotide-binding universal stress UspA family protein
MRASRRSRDMKFGAVVTHASPKPMATAYRTMERSASPDNSPIFVAVDGLSSGWDALEWAAAEATSRQCGLGIVHAVAWPLPALDLLGGFAATQWDPAIEAAAALLFSEAVSRALMIAPNLRITTHLDVGDTESAVLQHGHRSGLIVLGQRRSIGRARSFTRPIYGRVASRARCPVAIVKLSGENSYGPSTGRVVVGVDCTGQSTAAIGFAFRAAHRRGVGVTALHACTACAHEADLDKVVTDQYECRIVERALRASRDEFLDVDVRQRVVSSAAAPALLAESVAAALVVLGSSVRRLHRPLSKSVGSAVSRLAQSPVVIVPTR